MIALALVVALIFGVRTCTEKYTVSVDNGAALGKVVTERFAQSGQLKVATLSGTVQGVGSDVRFLGMLRSDRVMKAPYTVDYFVDLTKVARGDMVWEPKTKTLTVALPPIVWGRPDIQEDQMTLVRDTGLIVTRGAMQELQRQASGSAQRAAAGAAGQPKYIAQARDSARTRVSALLTDAIAVSGERAVVVRVLFRDEIPNDEVWDMSKPIDGVDYSRR